jgi:hypothetical protein
MLHERHPDAADHATDALAAGRLRVDDATGPIPLQTAIPLSAEAVWKVAGLVVFGIEPEAADGGLC